MKIPTVSPDVKLYNAATLDALSVEAAHSARLRKNLNVYPVLADPIQRLFQCHGTGHLHAAPSARAR